MNSLRRVHRPPASRGVSIVEALVAMTVTASGLLALAGVQTTLRINADIARQRTEATRIAEEELERLRSFGSLPAAEGAPGWDAVDTRPGAEAPMAAANARFTIDRRVVSVAGAALKAVAVEVSWIDRVGSVQRVVLGDAIAGVSPVLAGLLASPASRTPPSLLRARHPTIPTRARELSGEPGRSVFKPDETGRAAWVLDDVTGAVTQVCSVGAATTTGSLTRADLGSCVATHAQMLSGVVRFNLRGWAAARLEQEPAHWVVKPIPAASIAWKLSGSPVRVLANCQVAAESTAAQLARTGIPADACVAVDQAVSPSLAAADEALTAADAEDPRWPALPLDVALDLTSTGHRLDGAPQSPVCHTNAPTDSLAANRVRQHAVEYFCIVFPNDARTWSGSSRLVPRAFDDGGAAAWSIGAGATDYRVCRYTRARAAAAANVDHPSVYADVGGNLTEQNFLVVAGLQSCPTDNPADPAAGDLVDTHTLQHQP